MNKALILFLAIAAIACKKTNDSELPVITITSPSSSQMFAPSDSVRVAFTITDADLHAYSYLIVNTVSGDTLHEDGDHTHGNVTFDQKFGLPGTAMQLRLVVHGEDHNGNSNSASVDFHSM